MVYDALLLFSILFFATLILLPATGGEALSADNHLYHLYLFICCFFYFGWQWVRGGQTLGMKAWRIRVTDFNGLALTWKLAAIRFVLAVVSWLTFGAGFLWTYFDRDALTFHDRFSGTRLIRLT